jgi:hypothetical protein
MIDHGHSENAKQIEALGELIKRYADKAGVPITEAQTTIAARAVASTFDLAGKGTLVAFKQWVLAMQAAGAYENVGGDDNQAQNCAAEICC